MNPKKHLRIGSLALTVWFFSCNMALSLAAGVEEKDTAILAVIGDTQISARDLNERLLRLSAAQREAYSTEEGKQRLLRELVRIEVFSRQARVEGIDRSPDFERKLKEVTAALLADAYTKQKILVNVRVAEADAREYYHQHQDEFRLPERLRASSVFLQWPPNATVEEKARQKALAADILRRARAGEDFTALSQRYSSAPLNEDMDYFSRGRYAPEVEEKVFGLKVGEISPVIGVEGGLRIFKLEERLPAEVPSFDVVRGEILSRLQSERRIGEFAKAEQELFTKYRVEFSGTKTPLQQEDTASMTNHPAPAIQGKILQVTPAPKEVQKTGKKGVILMQSKAGSAYGFDQASIGIMDKTKLFRDKNKVRVEAAFGDLREGQEIQVFISQPLIMSYPVQADADTLIILDPDF